MIDCERWVLAEAWLANGLRLRWSYADDPRDKSWQGDASERYRYEGHGVWELPRPYDFLNRPFGQETAPQLSTATLRHELAHWLVATEDQRALMNFGIPNEGLEADEAEHAAVAAERVLSSVVGAAARIASLAIGAKP